jgi:hypothetical protein
MAGEPKSWVREEAGMDPLEENCHSCFVEDFLTLFS